MTLRSFRFPNKGLLVWSDTDWLRSILPSDSRKKKLLRRLGGLPILSRRFNGKVPFGDRIYDLDRILAQFADIAPFSKVSAIFVNSRRNLPRIYVWLQSEGHPMFLKIGGPTELPAFENEANALTELHTGNDLIVMHPLSLRVYDSLVLLLSQGMSLTMHQQKQRLSPDEVLSYFVKLGVKANGFFGGPVHGDLSSHNAFDVEGRLLVVDWESAAPHGPDYCDLIELCSTLLVADCTRPTGLAALKAQVRRSADLELDEVTLRNALKFLAQHGSINSQKILNSINKSN